MFRSVSIYLFLLFAGLLALAPLAGGQVFENPRLIKTNVTPGSFFVADLNGDGLLDIVWDRTHAFDPWNAPSELYPMLADGKGGYQPSPTVTLPPGILSTCMSGDVNGDGRTDLICSGSDYPGDRFAVLPGNGDGTFAPPIVVSLPQPGPYEGYGTIAAIGDLNGDGHLDVVVACEDASLIFPMLGDGTGHFTAAAPLYALAGKITLADLNGDGKLDMLAQQRKQIVGRSDTTVYLGTGDGSFDFVQGWEESSPINTRSYGSVLADVDGDGRLDILGGGFGVVRIFRGHGDGTFDKTATQTLDFQQGIANEGLGQGVYLYPFACQDLDGNGIADLVALGANGLIVFRGKGGLQFGNPEAYPEEEELSFGDYGEQHFADMDGDGHPDYIGLAPGGISLSYGRPDGSFASGRAYMAGRHVSSVALADFNEDGKLDVVTAGDVQLYLSLGKGDGAFEAADALPPVSAPVSVAPYEQAQTTGWTNLVTADMNGDGHKDLLAIGATEGSGVELFELLGHGDGSFDNPKSIYALEGQRHVQTLDVNNDGLEDVLVANGNDFALLVQQKDANFQVSSVSLTIPDEEYRSGDLALADLDGNGIPDLVYVTSKHAAVAAGLGDGSYAAPVYYALPFGSGRVAGYGGHVAIGDVDGDGRPDLAITQSFSGPGPNDQGTQVFVLYGQGKKGAFDSDSFTTAFLGPEFRQFYDGLFMADVNGDGRKDLVVDTAFGSVFPVTAEVVTGRPDRTLNDLLDIVDGYGDGPVMFADLNGDGRADLVKPNTYGNAFTVLLASEPSKAVGTLSVAPASVLAGSPFTINVHVSVAEESEPVQGSVSFTVDGKPAGSAVLAQGGATLEGSTQLPAGEHTVAALTSVLQGQLGSYAPVQMSTKLVVTSLPVTVSIAATPNPVTVGQSTTLSVTVRNGDGVPAGAPLPGGRATVAFDGKDVGSGSSDGGSGFQFTVPYTPQAVGTHVVAVQYGGDATHLLAAEQLRVTVVPAPVPGSMTLSVSPASLTLAKGTPASLQITLASRDGFAGSVSLSYSSLPPSVLGTMTASSLTLSSGSSARTTLSFTKMTDAPEQRAETGARRTMWAGLGGALLLLFPGKRRRRLKGAVSFLLLFGASTALNGCTDIGEPLRVVSPTTYTFTVRATPQAENVAPQSAIVHLTVVP